jgi:murein DD-endopeptidase MepM/ murein hydrolase activator NlpD
MSVPNIDVILYPQGPSAMQRQLYHLELAPADVASQPVCPLPLQVWVNNKEGSPIHLDTIDVLFSDPSLKKTVPINMNVNANQSNAWYAPNPLYIFLPSPPPSPFTVKLNFTGRDPWTDQVHFVRFPTSYQFPGKGADLAVHEFWHGKGAAHAGGGDQIFHYDLGIMGFDPVAKQWRDVFPGTDGTHNSDFRIWDRPVYALADGVVTFYQNDQDENPKPKVQLGGVGWGNAFNIQHGPYLATYMHMRKGSLNATLIQGFPQGVEFQNGAQVKAGDYLGRAGNAGSSSAPHLHVGLVVRDAQKRQFSIPLGFSGISVVNDAELDFSNVPGSPWVEALNQGLPWEDDPNVRNAVALGVFIKQPSIVEAAIDPLALLLGAHSDAYVRLTLPDPPPIDVITAQVRAQVAAMSPAERRRALTRLRGLEEYLAVMRKELAIP